ncbi:hypothetical protein CPC08DRAFT_90775 [Agrocybe pediades]|nr:hypothetical protein CPC08DRAFT_90775 [Agrocybe pediades]
MFYFTEIKDLQDTYNSLVSEVQAILDEHAHRHAQQAYLSAASPPIQPQPRSASPSFLSGLAIRGRGRSNTNPSATPPVIPSQRPSMDESSTSSHGQPLPYKELASRFYTINSKYRLSWECAELLIELGGAGGGDANGNANTKTGAGGNAGEVTSAPATSNTPTPSMQQAQASQTRGKSRERAITLAGDEEKPSSLNTFLSQQNQPASSTHPPLASPPSFAQSNSHPSASWRASTGRHDLSHRQLFLLREMLNNSHAVVSSTSHLRGSNDDDGAAGAGDDSQQSIPEDTIPRRIPLAVQSLQAVHMTANPTNVNVNRDWRWGDARNSTITLPSEEDGGGVQRGGRSRQQEEKEAKRKSSRMGMAGFRDMLKSLRRGSSAAESRPGSASGGGGTTGFFAHSTTSLSTQSSVGSKERGRHRYPHPKLPHPAPPPPPMGQSQSSQGRRRAKTAGEPDSMRSSKTAQATLSTGLGLGKASSSFGVGAGKASPRRPSLASIFRIGGAKNRSGNPPTDNEGSDNAYSASPPPPPSATTMASPTTDNDADNEGRSEDSSHSHGSGFVGGGAGPYGGGGSSTGEEDWDQMDSASDLDAAARAMGIRVGMDGGATVRGASSSKLQKNRKGRSPYLQRDMFDSPPPPPLPVNSTSPTSSSGQPLSPHSIVAKRSFNNSQSSLAVYQTHQGSPLASSHIPARTTRLSNVDEHQDDRPPTLTAQQPRTQTRPSSSRSNLAPRFSSNVNSKTASVRSTGPPLNLATTMTSPLPISAMALPLADPMKLAMTPENIKPLLENAKEVHARLEECIAEVRILLGRGSSQVNAPAAV